MNCPCCGQGIADTEKPMLSLETNRLSAGGCTIQLGRRQAEIISVLLDRMPMPVPAENMVARIYGAASMEPALVTIRVLVSKMRPRLAECGLKIVPGWGRGYTLEYIGGANGRP